MADFSFENVPEILVGMGWSPRTLDDHTWRCAVPTHTEDARIVVRHAGTWIYLAVMPFLSPESIRPWGAGKYPPRFLGRILAVNNNLLLVKFALDEDGDLALRVELPTESLQRREFETAAQMLLRTTEQYRGPIREALLEAHRASLLPDPASPVLQVPSADPPSPPPDSAPDEAASPPLPAGSPGALSDPPVITLSQSVPAPADEAPALPEDPPDRSP